MSNKNQLIQYLESGHKVRRRTWKEGEYIYLRENTIVNKDVEPVKLCNIKTLTAEDWEILKEDREDIFKYLNYNSPRVTDNSNRVLSLSTKGSQKIEDTSNLIKLKLTAEEIQNIIDDLNGAPHSIFEFLNYGKLITKLKESLKGKKNDGFIK